MQVRPNMVIATSLPYTMLTRDQMKSILDIVNRMLVTPRGLRTLSPSEEGYKGIYCGDQETRDSAYHQGTVWPWLSARSATDGSGFTARAEYHVSKAYNGIRGDTDGSRHINHLGDL
jgi:hypothetical protein